jgi:hypothetical protein
MRKEPCVYDFERRQRIIASACPQHNVWFDRLVYAVLAIETVLLVATCFV